MTEKPDRSWVWRSTETSRATGLVSVLAVAETLACVALYWVLWIWLGVTWHHWLIVVSAPLVLLRSEQSVAQGAKWFKAYRDNKGDGDLTSPKSLGIILFSVLVVIALSWWLATHWLVDATGWSFFGKAALVGWLSIHVGITVPVIGGLSGTVELRPVNFVAGAVALAGVVALWATSTVTSAEAAALAGVVLFSSYI